MVRPYYWRYSILQPYRMEASRWFLGLWSSPGSFICTDQLSWSWKMATEERKPRFISGLSLYRRRHILKGVNCYLPHSFQANPLSVHSSIHKWELSVTYFEEDCCVTIDLCVNPPPNKLGTSSLTTADVYSNSQRSWHRQGKVHPGRYIPASLRATVKGIVSTAIFKLTIKLTPAILLPLILIMLLWTSILSSWNHYQSNSQCRLGPW